MRYKILNISCFLYRDHFLSQSKWAIFPPSQSLTLGSFSVKRLKLESYWSSASFHFIWYRFIPFPSRLKALISLLSHTFFFVFLPFRVHYSRTCLVCVGLLVYKPRQADFLLDTLHVRAMRSASLCGLVFFRSLPDRIAPIKNKLNSDALL